MNAFKNTCCCCWQWTSHTPSPWVCPWWLLVNNLLTPTHSQQFRLTMVPISHQVKFQKGPLVSSGSRNCGWFTGRVKKRPQYPQRQEKGSRNWGWFGSLGAYSVVSGVGIASEVDQPHVVALVGHHEAEAVVGEDSLGRGGLVAMEV